MQKRILTPTIISSLRIAVLPFFFYLYITANIAFCLTLIAFSAATDFFDGYSARKLGATSRFGAYYDASTDFFLVIGIFAIFTANGYYPIWLLLLITVSFAQFLATSYYAKRLFDPIGRYIGSALYIGIVLTLVFPTQAIYYFVEYAFVGFFLISLGSRIISLARNRDNNSN